MPRFFAEPENIKGNTITLYSDDAAHISRVLRGKTGDILTVCDGTGSDYIAEITDISDKSVILEIKETLDTKNWCVSGFLFFFSLKSVIFFLKNIKKHPKKKNRQMAENSRVGGKAERQGNYPRYRSACFI